MGALTKDTIRKKRIQVKAIKFARWIHPNEMVDRIVTAPFLLIPLALMTFFGALFVIVFIVARLLSYLLLPLVIPLVLLTKGRNKGAEGMRRKDWYDSREYIHNKWDNERQEFVKEKVKYYEW